MTITSIPPFWLQRWDVEHLHQVARHLTAIGPPQNRTCTFPRIRLKQVLSSSERSSLPFCETVKIRDRDAVPQWSITVTASSGPFTRVTKRRECLTYPLVRASDSPKSSFAPTCPTSAPLRVGPQSVSGQLPKDLDGGSRRSFGIPVALTAAGISFLGHLVP